MFNINFLVVLFRSTFGELVEETPLNSKYSVKDFVKMLNETEPKVRQKHSFLAKIMEIF